MRRSDAKTASPRLHTAERVIERFECKLGCLRITLISEYSNYDRFGEAARVQESVTEQNADGVLHTETRCLRSAYR